VYLFPIAVVAKDCKLKYLKQHKLFHNSGDWKSKIGLTGVKAKNQQDCAASEDSREEASSLATP
jgi:hypothetical protein